MDVRDPGGHPTPESPGGGHRAHVEVEFLSPGVGGLALPQQRLKRRDRLARERPTPTPYAKRRSPAVIVLRAGLDCCGRSTAACLPGLSRVPMPRGCGPPRS